MSAAASVPGARADLAATVPPGAGERRPQDGAIGSWATPRGLVRACHPGPTVGVTAITVALALTAGRSLLGAVVIVGSAVLAGQLSVGWANDRIDHRRDASTDRTDKPIVAGLVSARTVGRAAIVAFALCVPLSLLSGPRAGAVHIGAVLAAHAYNAGVKSTVLSPVPYALAFGALPVFVGFGTDPGVLPPTWMIVAGALLGTGAHFMNTIPDREADAAMGIAGLPQRLPMMASLVVGVGLLTAAVAVIAFAPSGPVATTSAVAAVAAAVLALTAAWCAVTGRQRTAWRLALLLAVVAVAGFVTSGADWR